MHVNDSNGQCWRVVYTQGGLKGSYVLQHITPLDEARNCVETDIELVLPAGTDVLLDRGPPAVVRAPRLCDSDNSRPCRPARAPQPKPAA